MASLYSNRGAKRARRAREALGYTREGPLPDLLRVIEASGPVHVLVLALPEGVAGAHIAKPDCPLLFVNGQDAVTRQRFTLAHEFGHHRMGHSTVIDEHSAISGYAKDPNEICANAFAAEFLMPRDAIAAWGGERVDGPVTLEHVVVLAHEYGVSPQAARYALANARVLSDAKRCRQLDDEIAENLQADIVQRLGLEPLSDSLAEASRRLPRIAPALEGSALGDLLVRKVDAEGLAARIGRSVAEVEAMLAELQLDPLLPAVDR